MFCGAGGDSSLRGPLSVYKSEGGAAAIDECTGGDGVGGVRWEQYRLGMKGIGGYIEWS